MAISAQRAVAVFAPPLSAGRSNRAPTSPGTSKPSTSSTSLLAILSIWPPSSAAEAFTPGNLPNPGRARSDAGREGGPDQLGQAAGPHLVHHARPVNLDRARAYRQIIAWNFRRSLW